MKKIKKGISKSVNKLKQFIEITDPLHLIIDKKRIEDIKNLNLVRELIMTTPKERFKQKIMLTYEYGIYWTTFMAALCELYDGTKEFDMVIKLLSKYADINQKNNGDNALRNSIIFNFSPRLILLLLDLEADLTHKYSKYNTTKQLILMRGKDWLKNKHTLLELAEYLELIRRLEAYE